MKDKLASGRSSVLVSLPVLVGSLVLCVLAAFFRQTTLASILMFLCLLSGFSRLWAFRSAHKISITIDGGTRAFFPGEETEFDICVRNDKFLPVVWLEVVFPLARSLCMTSEDSRRPQDWEVKELQERGASDKLVGEKRCSFLLWYESMRFTSRWKANRRGVYSTERWHLRTGDGFGLTQVEHDLPKEAKQQFVVYPRLIPVSPQLFLRNLWNADTGSKGVMEDITVIRSTRDYQTSDSLKHINWRLTARGLPLSVNVYEDILPKNVHFLFDGESFSSPAPHLEELEDALSILASEVVRLAEQQVRCGLSLCQGRDTPATDIFESQTPEELLHALAAYEPLEEKRDPDKHEIILAQPAVFDDGAICQAAQRVGRFYYIAYDTEALSRSRMLRKLDPTNTSILTYQEAKPYGEFEVICLQHLKEGSAHE